MLGSFGHLRDQLGDLGAEALADIADFGLGLLDHLVQQRGGHDLFVEPGLVHQRRHRHRVLQILVSFRLGPVVEGCRHRIASFQKGRADDEGRRYGSHLSCA
jgi:hypothetical protein